MGKKVGKYKVVGSDAKVELFKIPKTLFETLNEDSTDFKLLVRDMVDGSRITLDAERAILDLSEKVKQTSNPEAKKFWADRLEALMRVLGLNSKMRDRFMLIQHEYTRLYNLNSDLSDKVKELEERLEKYENI